MIWLRMAALALVATAAIAPAYAEGLRTGNDWMRASEDQRFAYFAGVSDTISAGARYDERNVANAPRTFMRQAQSALSGTTLEQGVETVSAWYRANPDELDKPVLSVVWREIAMPRLSEK